VLTVSDRAEQAMSRMHRQAGAPVSGRATVVALALLFTVVVLHVVSPIGEITYTLAIGGGIAVGVYGLSRLEVLWPWRCLVAAAALWAVAGLLSDFAETQGDLTRGRSVLPDLFALPGYLCFGAALYGLARSRRPADPRESMLDGLIIGAGSLLIVYEMLIAPTLDMDDTWVVARIVVSIYPAISMCLLALAARLAFSYGVRSTAFDLLLIGTACLLVGDVMYALGETGRIDVSPRLLEVPYLAIPACMGAAMLHPSARHVAVPTDTSMQPMLRRRLVPVVCAMFIPIVIMAVHRGSAVPVISVAIAFVLAAAAIARIARAMERDASLRSELAHRASHDDLTGLPVRSVVLDRLGEWLAEERDVALLFIDLDHFKFVNDSMGHGVGDQLLVQVAERLTSAAPHEAFVARQSGDEFIVALADCDVLGATALAETLRRRICEPYQLDTGEAVIAASIGISHSDRRPGIVPADLLREADTAMYRSKESGRDASTMFDASMHERMLRRVELERSLRYALENGDVTVAFQPIVDHRSGRIDGFEALARWVHDGESISPVEFVPVAEDSGLIVPMGWFVLDEACRQLAWWRANLDEAESLYVSVNVSPRQMRVSDFVDVVADVLARHGLPGDALWLEITERVVMDDSLTVLALMTGLRSLGVHLAIDDFGTGYSSLSYLKRFPLERVKIDRSFVAGVGVQDADSSLVHAIIAMASALGLDQVAEGVESAEQADRLAALGCSSMQGYHFGQPVGSDDVVAEWRRRTRLVAASRGVRDQRGPLVRPRVW
jgi:diguanylate cyclase (GGDEF)-like protein